MKPRQILRADPPQGKPKPVDSQPAKVVPITGLRISEPRKTAAQIYARGLIKFKYGQYNEACLDFKQASQDRRRLASCLLMASRCYRRSGRDEKALALLRVAVDRSDWSADEAALLRQELQQLQQGELSPLPAEILQPEQEVTKARAAEKPQEVAPSAQIAPASAVDLYAAPTSKLITVPFGLLVTAVILTGYLLRGEQHLTAESGAGYMLGIVGSLLMLVLMLYPLRKKARFMRNWGPIPVWFRFHMLAGIIGPVLILFHANFQLGSLNSKVVLGSTLLVAGSGIFGRYLYTKIHYGLYGKRVDLEQMHDAISNNLDNLAIVFVYAPRIQQRLLGFDDAVLRQTSGLLQSIGRVVMTDLRRRWTHLQILLVLRRALKITARRNNWSAKEAAQQYRAANQLVSRHLTAVLKVAEFSFYERFFALWHIFHMPLFFLLVIALVLHVIAVHMF